MFLWKDYLKENTEQMDNKLDIQYIYKGLKEIEEIDSIYVGKSDEMDDGRKKTYINLDFDNSIDVEDIISEVMRKFIGLDLRVESINRQNDKNYICLRISIYPKFCNKEEAPEINMPNIPMGADLGRQIKVIKLGN